MRARAMVRQMRLLVLSCEGAGGVRSALLVAALLALAPGCSSNQGGGICRANLQTSCPCADGTYGFQVCKEDGSGFGACSRCGQAPAPDAGPGFDLGAIPF